MYWHIIKPAHQLPFNTLCPEPFLSALQNMGVEFLHIVKYFHQGEVLFVQAAYNFLHATLARIVLGICTKISEKCQL